MELAQRDRQVGGRLHRQLTVRAVLAVRCLEHPLPQSSRGLVLAESVEDDGQVELGPGRSPFVRFGRTVLQDREVVRPVQPHGAGRIPEVRLSCSMASWWDPSLIYLASRPDTFDEDEAWSVALACGSLFALVGIVERPSWRNLDRSPTGYAAILATLLIAGWFGLGRAGPDRRSWAIPLMAAGLVPLVVGCSIDEAKFGLLFGAPFSKQQVYQFYHYGRVNGGQYISLHWLPDTVR